ncbi:hypothetical protein T484DRAFT_1855568 [Baffinella frigidus]|nr:hypothetical protein T484DRAFT_1855568 [Cryptophyta sp. CCMP2293]
MQRTALRFHPDETAQKAWGRTPLWKRAQLLRNAAASMRENAEAIAQAIAQVITDERRSRR